MVRHDIKDEESAFMTFPFARLRSLTLIAVCTGGLMLSGCFSGGDQFEVPRDSSAPLTSAEQQALFGQGKQGAAGAGLGVNAFLWRASLDTISFMPLASADSFGGVIITDWYSPPETPAERFKVDIYILGRELQPAGIRATVFRQKQNEAGMWVDAPVDEGTGQDLEDTILTRARQLRVESAKP